MSHIQIAHFEEIRLRSCFFFSLHVETWTFSTAEPKYCWWVFKAYRPKNTRRSIEQQKHTDHKMIFNTLVNWRLLSFINDFFLPPTDKHTLVNEKQQACPETLTNPPLPSHLPTSLGHLPLSPESHPLQPTLLRPLTLSGLVRSLPRMWEPILACQLLTVIHIVNRKSRWWVLIQIPREGCTAAHKGHFLLMRPISLWERGEVEEI